MTDERINDLISEFLDQRGGYVASASESELFWLVKSAIGVAREHWTAERNEAIAVLRRICAEYGDNDWPDNLHLADVLEKHLERHLSAD